MGILMMIFLQKLKKEKFLKVLYMGISKIFSKKKMENQHFLHVFRIHTYVDLDNIFHRNGKNENILHITKGLWEGRRNTQLFIRLKYKGAGHPRHWPGAGSGQLQSYTN